MNYQPKPRATRRGVCDLLNANGFPIAYRQLEKLWWQGKGPPEIGRFGGRALYDPDVAIACAESRFRPADPKAA